MLIYIDGNRVFFDLFANISVLGKNNGVGLAEALKLEPEWVFFILSSRYAATASFEASQCMQSKNEQCDKVFSV